MPTLPTPLIRRLTVLFTAALIGAMGVGAADAHAPDDPTLHPVVTEGDDTVSVVVETQGVAGTLRPTAQASFQPFSADKWVAWRQLTQVPATHVWEVWYCQLPGEQPVDGKTPAQMISAFDTEMADYFRALSNGAYVPTFVGKGSYKANDMTSCIDHANPNHPYYAGPGKPAALPGDRALLAITGRHTTNEFDIQGKGGPGWLNLVSSSDGTSYIELVKGTRAVAVSGIVAKYGGGNLLAHEMGHGLGFGHVPLSSQPDYPYSNLGDIMSDGTGGTAAIHRYAAGWFGPNQVTEWTGGTKTYRLGDELSSRHQMVVIPTDTQGNFYTLSARSGRGIDRPLEPDPYYGAPPAAAGIEVHSVRQHNTTDYCISDLACTLIGREVVAHVVPDVTPNTKALSTFGVGESLKVGSFSVTVTAEHADGYSVELSGSRPKTLSGGSDTGTTSDPRSRFEDVPTNHTFHGDITKLADSGITRGCNPPQNSRYCPDDRVTRGQMATFLVRALNLSPAAGTFGDVPANNPHRADIAALAAAGITKGCNPPTNNRYCPDAPVTRGQMATFLVRALGLAPASGTFGDVPANNPHRADIAALAAAGITRGCNPPANTRFCPDDGVTRAQMAAFLVRAGLAG